MGQSAWLDRYFVRCGVIMASLTVTSCLKPGASKIKHKFGETNRSDADAQPCVYDEKASENTVADLYLKSIATEIASRNPDTFKGRFAIGNICFYYKTDSEINATAALKKNVVHFNSALVNAAASDAEIAAVMAHELAHLTMQSEHIEIAPQLLTNPEWQKLIKDSHQKVATFNSEITRLNKEFEPADQSLAAMEQKFIAKLSPDQKKRGKQIGFQRIDMASLLINTPNAKMSHRDLTVFPGYRTIWVAYAASSEDGSYARFNPPSDMSPKPDKEIEDYQKSAADFASELKKAFPADTEALYQQYDKIRPIETRKDEAWSLLKKIRKEMEADSARLDPKGVRHNWMEQEADEVGLELYLRAGFKWSDFPWLSYRLMKPDELERCRKEHIEKNVEPTRGDGSHPEFCWRMFNALVTEARFHKDDYAPFVNNATVNIPGSKLTEIKTK